MATIPSTGLFPATSGVYPSGNIQIAGIVPRLEASGATSASGS